MTERGDARPREVGSVQRSRSRIDSGGKGIYASERGRQRSKHLQPNGASQPEDPPTGTQETPGDRPEVEEEYEPASGEAMEEQGNGAGRGGAEAESFLRFSFSFSFLFSFVSAFGAQETLLWLATVCGRRQWSC